MDAQKVITHEDIQHLADESIFQIYRQAVEHFPSGSVFVEIGCYTGGSTIFLAQAIKESGKKIDVYAVDLWANMTHPNRDYTKKCVDGSIFFEFWQNVWAAECEQVIKPIQFDSSSTAGAFKDKSVDFVFIDGGHRYHEVKADIEKWLPKLKDGGWVGGHDYNQEVEQVVKEILGQDGLGMEIEKHNPGELSFLVRF